jgi:hypothetical protein
MTASAAGFGEWRVDTWSSSLPAGGGPANAPVTVGAAGRGHGVARPGVRAVWTAVGAKVSGARTARVDTRVLRHARASRARRSASRLHTYWRTRCMGYVCRKRLCVGVWRCIVWRRVHLRLTSKVQDCPRHGVRRHADSVHRCPAPRLPSTNPRPSSETRGTLPAGVHVSCRNSEISNIPCLPAPVSFPNCFSSI